MAAKKESQSVPQNEKKLVGKFLTAAQELTDLIRSVKPVIYLESNESEKTIINIIGKICEDGTHGDKYKRQLYIWDSVKGLYSREIINGYPETTVHNDQAKDPGAILDVIISEQPKSGDSCYILCEFHHYLENSNIQRRLRNFVEEVASRKRKNIILLCPKNAGMSRDGKKIPMELENIVHIFEWPIPDSEVLRDSVCGSLIPSFNLAFKNRNPPLPELKFDEDAIDELVNSFKGLTLAEVESAACSSVVKTQTLVPEIIIKAKKQIIKKSGLVEYIEPRGDKLDDVGGVENLKKWLNERKPILSENAFEFGCDMPNGMMLIGPWGTGKSTVAKAVINEWGLPGLRIDAAKIMDSFVGSSERNAAAALKVADSVAPCILWWDEIDDLFSGAASSAVSDGGTTSRVIGTISTWMNEHEGLVFNIFTANDVSNRPPKLFRKGRIDEIFIVDLPTEEERKEIFNIHIEKRRQKGYVKERRIDIDKFAKMSKMFSGAEIREAVNTGFIRAYNDGKRDIKTADIFDAIKNTIPLSCTMKENLIQIRKWQQGRAVRASIFSPEEIIDFKEYSQGILNSNYSVSGESPGAAGLIDV